MIVFFSAPIVKLLTLMLDEVRATRSAIAQVQVETIRIREALEARPEEPSVRDVRWHISTPQSEE